MAEPCYCRDCSPEPARLCEACEEGDHAMCGRQTWCQCDCDPEAAMDVRTDEGEPNYFGGEWTDDSYFVE